MFSCFSPRHVSLGPAETIRSHLCCSLRMSDVGPSDIHTAHEGLADSTPRRTGHISPLLGLPASPRTPAQLRRKRVATSPSSSVTYRSRRCPATAITDDMVLPRRQRVLRYLNRISFLPTKAWKLPSAADCEYCGARRFFREPPGFCCASGSVHLIPTRMPLSLWQLYTTTSSHLADHFQQRCRTYNNSSAFTSIGIYYDHELCRGTKGIYTFKVQGGIYHFIRDLIPTEGCGRQLQLYFYGTENEIDNRLSQSGDLDAELIAFIIDIMKLNPYANFFRSLRDMPDLTSYKIVLRADPSLDHRVYNLPVVDHVGAIWNELTDAPSEVPHDVRVYTKSDGTQFVHYYYGCYDPLQYPLLFPYGEPGWHTGILKGRSTLHASDPGLLTPGGDLSSLLPAQHISGTSLLDAEQENLDRNRDNRRNVAAREFYCYRFQLRRDDITNILCTGRLIQQYQIDMYVKIETQRLDYFRKAQAQSEIRSESFQGIVDSMACDGISYGNSIGLRTVLPASFLGGPRDLRRRYMNALALVTTFGRPDFFITMTCNPNWLEIQDELLPGEHAHNRADLLARVFRAKNEELKDEIVDKQIFGKVAAYLYVVEFQKRGLPHVHWLVILKNKYKVTSVDAYDRFVSAEIPDPSTDPHLHSCVSKHMLHGPCGELNPTNVCMRGGACKNHYPREFVQSTSHRTDSYPAYRRRNSNRTVLARRKLLDNRWVIPYNPYLLAKFDSHINVEICADVKVVKYLYKYVCKGSDKIAYNVVAAPASGNMDEIHDFQSARWLCAPEAMWRIYGYTIYEMSPAVIQLHVHLPNSHYIFFHAARSLESILSNPNNSKTQLTQFFSMNATHSDVRAMGLLYREFPKHFVWKSTHKEWSYRNRGTAIGRLVTVSPVETERYYLRLLLSHVRAPTSFEYLRTHNGVLLPNFREAAMQRGLLDADNDIRASIEEASTYQVPYTLRRLFATILVYNLPSNPATLWEEFKLHLSADFLSACNQSEHVAFDRALRSIDVFLQSMGKTVDDFNLVPFKTWVSEVEMRNNDYENELNISVTEEELNAVHKLNSRQQEAFDSIMACVDDPNGGAFFIDGPGGSGKTFLYRTLLAIVRKTRGVALAVASSGVAASLLPGGRTAHSRFKLPTIVDQSISCAIKKQSVHAQLILSSKLIIWDEASMANRRCIEALDVLLRDLTDNPQLFGGKTIVFGGDFRQTIPVVVGGSREDAVDSCLVNSPLWPKVQKIHLIQNMRAREDPFFTELLLRIGDGTEPLNPKDEITLPTNMCLPYVNCDEPLDYLIAAVFPSLDDFHKDPFSVINRAILTPKNDCMESINNAIIDKFPGELVEYISVDITNNVHQQCQYQDFLNGVSATGLPPHVLRLKKNSPIMLLRNINPSEGLCNGTRLICRDLGKKVIGAVIASGEYTGKFVFIPRIPLETSDNFRCPIPFKRHQFPIRLCFAMSINKAQGQTLDKVGIYLPQPVFSHGQLYVALSRVRCSSSVKVLIKPPTAIFTTHCQTKNVVYKEILNAAM